MTDALAAAAKKPRTLVEFSWGDPPKFARYTDWTDDVVYGGGAFKSTPSIEIDHPPNVTGVPQKTPIVILPTDSFTIRLSSGEPIPRIAMRIFEIITSQQGTAAIRTRYIGEAAIATRNYQGRRGVSMIEGGSLGVDLDFALGICETDECQNPFGGPGCFKSLVGLTGTGVVAAIDDAVVTVTGLPVFGGKHWLKGSFRRDALDIMIRDWSTDDPTRFVLVRQPPAEWIGQSVVATPGCDKQKTTCEFWNNVSQFNGIGRKMLAYDPMIENPT